LNASWSNGLARAGVDDFTGPVDFVANTPDRLEGIATLVQAIKQLGQNILTLGGYGDDVRRSPFQNHLKDSGDDTAHHDAGLEFRLPDAVGQFLDFAIIQGPGADPKILGVTGQDPFAKFCESQLIQVQIQQTKGVVSPLELSDDDGKGVAKLQYPIVRAFPLYQIDQEDVCH
jgi:hypothetical protein